jgi:hypothetical protein
MSEGVRQTELQEHTQRLLQGPLKHIRVAALAAALVPLASVAAVPASAQSLCASGGTCVVAAVASATCTTYTLTAAANTLFDQNVTYAVNYTIVVTPAVGTPTTINDSVLLTPDPDFNATTTVTKSLGSLAGDSTLSGSATLVDSSGATYNAIDIAFSPSSLSCGAPPPPPNQCVGAKSTLITNLGSAGPSRFAVLSLGGSGALVNINLAYVAGNVGVPNFGTFKESAPSTVTGRVVVGSSVNTRGVVGSHGPIVVDDSTLATAVNDARAAATFFAGLNPTAIQGQFPVNGQITGNLTVTGTVGLNVVNLSNFLLNNGSLTLTGPAGAAFVINDSGNFNLHSGTIQVGGGVGPLDVVYNITNQNATVTTMVPTTAVGILLAPNNAINTMDSSTYAGEIIGGFGKTITLMSGSHVLNPCQ